MSGKGPKYAFGLLLTPERPSRRSASGPATRRGGASPSASLHSTTSSAPGSSARSTSSLSTPGAHRRTRSRSPFGDSSFADRSSDPTTSISSFRQRSSGSGGRGGRNAGAAGRFRAATPSSMSSTSSVREETEEGRSVMVALVEGRGLAQGEIGLATIDMHRPELVLSQFSDNPTYVKLITKLRMFWPLEIVMPDTVYQGSNVTKLFRVMGDLFPHSNLCTVARKYFNETRGMEALQRLCLPNMTSVFMAVRTKYYCLAAAGALLRYVEFIQNMTFARASLRVSFQTSEFAAMIDTATAGHLELLCNSQDPKSRHSLFGVLNYTKTCNGARRLRASIQEPLTNEETLRSRLDSVDELLQEDIFVALQNVIRRFLDVDHLLSMLIQIPKVETLKTAEAKINHVIHLKHVLELVAPLQKALQNCRTPVLAAYRNSLSDPRYATIMHRVSCVLSDDVYLQKGCLYMKMQRCFAVRPHPNSFLDVARRVFNESLDDIEEIIRQLGEIHGLPLKMSYTTVRGFHMQMPLDAACATASALPEVFIKVSKRGKRLSFTTMDLMRLNARCEEAVEEITLLSNVVVSRLLYQVREDLPSLYRLGEAVSMLDMLLSFAHVTSISNYVRPNFSDTLAIKGGRHAIQERVASAPPPVPNDVFMSDGSNFLIVTGPNNSGKSTLLKLVVLCQVMAQIGCFVPAKYACFRIADQIFARIGVDDDIETNASTFTLEMREANYILQNATSRSLIIIDELGRGTNAEDGLGVCHAICENLLERKAFTLFATHYLELCELESVHPNVSNCHFELQQQQRWRPPDAWSCGRRGRRTPANAAADRPGEPPNCVYTLVMGRTTETHYGLEMASVSLFPTELLQEAKKISERIRAENWFGVQQAPAVAETLRRQAATHQLGRRLVQAARHSRLDSPSLASYLSELRIIYAEEATGRPAGGGRV